MLVRSRALIDGGGVGNASLTPYKGSHYASYVTRARFIRDSLIRPQSSLNARRQTGLTIEQNAALCRDEWGRVNVILWSRDPSKNLSSKNTFSVVSPYQRVSDFLILHSLTAKRQSFKSLVSSVSDYYSLSSSMGFRAFQERWIRDAETVSKVKYCTTENATNPWPRGNWPASHDETNVLS